MTDPRVTFGDRREEAHPPADIAKGIAHRKRRGVHRRKRDLANLFFFAAAAFIVGSLIVINLIMYAKVGQAPKPSAGEEPPGGRPSILRIGQDRCTAGPPPTMAAVLPAAVVFDLDFTLWDAGGTWCDHTDPPYRLEGAVVRDAAGRTLRLYPEVTAVLDRCEELGLPVASASRTHAPDIARELLVLFGIEHRFSRHEIYPAEKERHLCAIARDAGCAVTDLLFYDDEARNLQTAKAMGVTALEVPDGMDLALLAEGLRRFAAA